MDDILRGVVTNGSASRARQVLKRNDVGGKTGTTNGAVDVWFSGYTQNLATTVWMGFDQPRPLGNNEFGSGLALSTWLSYMQPVLKGVPETKPRPMPEGLIVDNGDYYFAEFPPGQAVAALDLPSGDALADFMNNVRGSDTDHAVRPFPSADNPPPEPAAAPTSGAQPARTPEPPALGTAQPLPVRIPDSVDARPL